MQIQGSYAPFLPAQDKNETLNIKHKSSSEVPRLLDRWEVGMVRRTDLPRSQRLPFQAAWLPGCLGLDLCNEPISEDSRHTMATAAVQRNHGHHTSHEPRKLPQHFQDSGWDRVHCCTLLSLCFLLYLLPQLLKIG